MADLAAPRRAHAAGLAHRVGREVVVQHVVLADVALERVDHLLVLAGAERRHAQRLRLAAREQRRAVDPRQHAHHGLDRPHGRQVAAVDAPAGIEDLVADDVRLELLELVADQRQPSGVLAAEQLLGRGLDRLDLLVAQLLGGLAVGLAQRRLEIALHGAHRARRDRPPAAPRAPWRRPAASSMIRSITGWNWLWPNTTAASMVSSDSSLASDSTIITASRVPATTRSRSLRLGLLDRRVEDELAVRVADPGGSDRAQERHAADGQRRRGRDHGQDVGIVLAVMGQHGDDDLGLVPEAVREQRPDRPVDQARGQRLLLGRAALALEEPARDLAGGERLLLVVDGEREEVLAGLDAPGGDGGRTARPSRPAWPARRRRPGARSCRSPGRACGRPRSFPCG